ncbi:protein FAM161B isoform X2 [Phyllobates terribilis]|uniref:protein FAM161B isoform X2 n=1 Tax=Phyllobates terribilis TaxID=111132 RepID=UPI003CCA7053
MTSLSSGRYDDQRGLREERGSHDLSLSRSRRGKTSCFTMAWSQEPDEQIADEDVMEMMQGLKIRSSLILQDLTCLHEACIGPALTRSAEPASKPKANIFSQVPECTIPQPFQMMLREAEKRKMLQPQEWADLQDVQPQEWADLQDGQSGDDAECLKQFRAQPAPAHVFLPMYKEIMEQNEKRRKIGIQRRSHHLLSMQKPFQLLVHNKRRQVASAFTAKVPIRKRPIPKSVLDPTVSDGLRESKILQKINNRIRAKELLEKSSAPVPLTRDTRDPQSRASWRTKQQHLGFLQQNLTFKPQINPCAPDFQRLHYNFQKSSLKNQRMREETETKPFNLRTASLRPQRPSTSHDAQETSTKTPPRRFVGSLSSLSANTLPIYITDCTKRREMAIRSSVQDRNDQAIEREKWILEHQQKSLAMQKSVSRRAKALDSHKPLAACKDEKLKQKRHSDRIRTQDYKVELEEMKKRVNMRDYLFEQGFATKDMERRSTQTLIKARRASE